MSTVLTGEIQLLRTDMADSRLLHLRSVEWYFLILLLSVILSLLTPFIPLRLFLLPGFSALGHLYQFRTLPLSPLFRNTRPFVPCRLIPGLSRLSLFFRRGRLFRFEVIVLLLCTLALVDNVAPSLRIFGPLLRGPFPCPSCFLPSGFARTSSCQFLWRSRL